MCIEPPKRSEGLKRENLSLKYADRKFVDRGSYILRATLVQESDGLGEAGMIYVGHFWFESHDRVARGSVGWHGYFTCVAEAESVEKALGEFAPAASSSQDLDRP